MMLPTLWFTDRLATRDVDAADLDLVLDSLAESADMAELDPTFGPAPRSEIEELIARSQSQTQAEHRSFQMQLFQARDSGEVAGYWHLTRIPDRHQAVGVSILLVRPSFRRLGLGQELVSSAAHRLAAGHSEFWSRVFLRNSRAIAFWAGLGFDRLVKHRGAFVLKPEEAPSVILMKQLHDSGGHSQ